MSHGGQVNDGPAASEPNGSGREERRSFLKRIGLWSLVALVAPVAGFVKRAMADEDTARVRALADPGGPVPQSCEGTQQCNMCHWACNHGTCT